MEYERAKFEARRQRLRCTIVRGPHFAQSYLLQLPGRVIFPLMAISALMHWLLSQALSTREIIFADSHGRVELSQYQIAIGPYPIWIAAVVMIALCALCWWAFTQRREGFIPQMYGSIRACCAATTQLDDFPPEGIQWGDLGQNGTFRQAGFSVRPVGKIKPGEVYC